jgi:uncharacterized protein with HEPN domain
MTDERLVEYLVQMNKAAALAVQYVEGYQKAIFLKDTRTQQAVIMNLLIVGELATKLLKEHGAFLAVHPQVPWSGMKGMRNRIAHGYFEINLDTVWETISTALPDLLKQLPSVLQSARGLHD